jgi:hypothetical protein
MCVPACRLLGEVHIQKLERRESLTVMARVNVKEGGSKQQAARSKKQEAGSKQQARSKKQEYPQTPQTPEKRKPKHQTPRSVNTDDLKQKEQLNTLRKETTNISPAVHPIPPPTCLSTNKTGNPSPKGLPNPSTQTNTAVSRKRMF